MSGLDRRLTALERLAEEARVRELRRRIEDDAWVAAKMVPYHLRRDGCVIVGRMATWVPTGGGRAFAHRLVSEPEQEPTGGVATEPKRTGLPHASKHEGAADRDEGDGHAEGLAGC